MSISILVLLIGSALIGHHFGSWEVAGGVLMISLAINQSVYFVGNALRNSIYEVYRHLKT